MQSIAELYKSNHLDCKNLPLTASPGVMGDIDKQKPFIALPRDVLFYVLTHDEISPAAKMLWSYIALKVRSFKNEAWAVKISVGHLAEALSASERSIQRYLSELDNCNLIVREQRFRDHRQLSSIIRITIPYGVAQGVLKSTPARGSGAKLSMVVDNSYNDTGKKGDKSHTCDKAVTGEGDTAVTLNNNNSKHISKKHRSLEDCDVMPQQRISRLRDLLSSGFKDSKILITEKPAPSEMPFLLKKSAEKKLKHMGFYGNQLEQLLNEINFSLKNKTWQGESEKVVNSCLKLIRQNKWRTPFAMLN